MPGYDGTGPSGSGPMTGGGRGLCGTDERNVPRGIGRRIGRGGRFRGAGFGRGMGAGRGWGASPFPAGVASTRSLNTAEELEMLKAESEQISLALDAIRKRMEALEKPDE